MKLHEILTDKDRLQMAYTYLKKLGFRVSLGSLWVKVEGASFSVHFYPTDNDEWWNIWYRNGRKAHEMKGLSFEDAVKDIAPLLPT
jgi:hypothetical protein